MAPSYSFSPLGLLREGVAQMFMSSFELSRAAASGLATELTAVIAVFPTWGTFDAIIIDYKVPLRSYR